MATEVHSFTAPLAPSLGGAQAATQAEQEAASSTTLMVSPGRQQFHPSAFKFWCRGQDDTTLDASYNVSSVTDNGAGDHTYNFTVSFSSVNYFVVAMGGNFCNLTNDTAVPAAGSVRIISQNLVGVNTDPVRWFVGGAGDQ